MFKSIAAASLLAASSFFITAAPAMADCQDSEVAATVGGAIVGGFIGNQFGRGGGRTAATVGGVLLGGFAGREIARDSCRDKRYDAYYYNGTYEDAFESSDDRNYEWENPYSHNHGYVRPIAYYEDGYEGHRGPCRSFEQRIWIDGEAQTGTGVACRRSDGSWKIISNDD